MTDRSASLQPDLLAQLQRIFWNEKQRRRKTARLPLPLLDSVIKRLQSTALLGTERGEDTDAVLLTPKEAAELLKISTGTLANWRTKGTNRLKFVKCEGRIRYKASDVRDYLERQQATHTGERSRH